MPLDRLRPDLEIVLPLDPYAPRAARHRVAQVGRPSPDLRDALKAVQRAGDPGSRTLRRGRQHRTARVDARGRGARRAGRLAVDGRRTGARPADLRLAAAQPDRRPMGAGHHRRPRLYLVRDRPPPGAGRDGPGAPADVESSSSPVHGAEPHANSFFSVSEASLNRAAVAGCRRSSCSHAPTHQGAPISPALSATCAWSSAPLRVPWCRSFPPSSSGADRGAQRRGVCAPRTTSTVVPLPKYLMRAEERFWDGPPTGAFTNPLLPRSGKSSNLFQIDALACAFSRPEDSHPHRDCMVDIGLLRVPFGHGQAGPEGVAGFRRSLEGAQPFGGEGPIGRYRAPRTAMPLAARPDPPRRRAVSDRSRGPSVFVNTKPSGTCPSNGRGDGPSR